MLELYTRDMQRSSGVCKPKFMGSMRTEVMHDAREWHIVWLLKHTSCTGYDG